MSSFSVPFPIVPQNDLRSQLPQWILKNSLTGLQAGKARRRTAFSSGSPEEYQEEIREYIQRGFGPLPFSAKGVPLKARTVSRHRTRHAVIENVLFESYPGWEVNATLFIPHGTGPFPAVIIPVGHSGKQFANYQLPAQAFASLGFLSVLFDPPGQRSEKQRGNDHFRDGVRNFLLGPTSNRFFVLDALRCIDYLETRKEADTALGVAMTGVSGGGITTLFASVFDERIVCSGPSCCLNLMKDHPVGDMYSACPEQFWRGRLTEGVDNVDVALAFAPKPMLYMAGKNDEVFQIDASRSLAETIRRGYSCLGKEECFNFFEDESGHAYTLSQAEQFAGWMRRWLVKEAQPQTPRLDKAAFEMLDYEMLRCYPAEEDNMFTLCKREALQFKKERPPKLELAALHDFAGESARVTRWEEGGSFRIWTQGYREALCRIDELDIPLSVITPWEPHVADSTIIWVDPEGRRAALEGMGEAAGISKFTERNPEVPHPRIYLPDLPGWGEGACSLTPYALSSWGSMQRLLSYQSYGLGKSLLLMKAQWIAAITREVIKTHQLSPEEIILYGKGTAGTAVLLAAVLLDEARPVVLQDSLYSFLALLEEEFYLWEEELFLPGALPAFDIPELCKAAAGKGIQIVLKNPLDGRKESVALQNLPGELKAPGIEVYDSNSSVSLENIFDTLLRRPFNRSL